jgi:hypothetical protein
MSFKLSVTPTVIATPGGIALAPASPAAACPIQGCHVPPTPPPPTPHPPTPPQPKYRVTILTVYPVVTEDETVDEAYVKVNGWKIAGPVNVSNSPGGIRALRSPSATACGSSRGTRTARIPTTGWASSTPSLPGLGGTNQFWADSYGGGAHYQLEIRVERIS